MNGQAQLNRLIKITIPILILSLLILSLTSCCDECPVIPDEETQPYQGYLYAVGYYYDEMDIQQHWIYKFETETDSVIDSVAYSLDANNSVDWFEISPDGSYLALCQVDTLTSEGITLFYNTQNLSLLTELPKQLHTVFLDDENTMLAFGTDSVFYYSLPDLNITFADSIGYFAKPILDERHDLIYGIADKNPSNTDSVFLETYDYKQKTVAEKIPIINDAGEWLYFTRFDIYPENDLVCLLGQFPDPISVFLNETAGIVSYDLAEHEILYHMNTVELSGQIQISPDGREIYVADAGYMGLWLIWGTVYIFDAHQGNYLCGISLYGYSPYKELPLFPSSQVFTPTGEKVYIGTDGKRWASGTIIVINTEEREISKFIWPEMKHYVKKLAIGPKL